MLLKFLQAFLRSRKRVRSMYKHNKSSPNIYGWMKITQLSGWWVLTISIISGVYLGSSYIINLILSDILDHGGIISWMHNLGQGNPWSDHGVIFWRTLYVVLGYFTIIFCNHSLDLYNVFQDQEGVLRGIAQVVGFIWLTINDHFGQFVNTIWTSGFRDLGDTMVARELYTMYGKIMWLITHIIQTIITMEWPDGANQYPYIGLGTLVLVIAFGKYCFGW